MAKHIFNWRLWLTALVLLGISGGYLSAYRSHQQAEQRMQRDEALFQAIERGDHTHIESLVQSGVSVNARRFSNPPSLWEPWQRIQIRLEYHDYPFQIGYTPLMTASIRGDLWTARFLLDHGAEVQAIKREHEEPAALDLAIEYRHPAMVRLLLDRGANPNGAPGSYGPLLMAWRVHDQAIMDLLLHHGAKPLPAALKAMKPHVYL